MNRLDFVKITGVGAAGLPDKFTDFTGVYLYHCHNLEHEDLGMMPNYLVRSA